MDIQPSEISKILKEEIKNFGSESEITEVGHRLRIGIIVCIFTTTTPTDLVLG